MGGNKIPAFQEWKRLDFLHSPDSKPQGWERAYVFSIAMRYASYNEVRMDPEFKGRLIESGNALAQTMISEKSSTMFARANIRLTRSQRRGI